MGTLLNRIIRSECVCLAACGGKDCEREILEDNSIWKPGGAADIYQWALCVLGRSNACGLKPGRCLQLRARSPWRTAGLLLKHCSLLGLLPSFSQQSWWNSLFCTRYWPYLLLQSPRKTGSLDFKNVTWDRRDGSAVRNIGPPPEDTNLIPGTHVVAHNYKSNSQASEPSASLRHRHADTKISMYLSKIKDFFLMWQNC